MNKLGYTEYLDKVYGCWLGKCISGNIGAPYEGMKQYLSLEYSSEYLNEILPNDDLDLQVLWLEVLRRKGENFTSDDLADIFASNCEYAPGEYAFFKKNHRRRIPTPYSGEFNNEYYKNGMGAPIRSEIWACVAACNPELAARFASLDAIVDHSADSCAVGGERFLAALESMAFACSNVRELIIAAAKYVDGGSRLYALIQDSVRWCDECGSVAAVREKIVNEYGSAEATDCLQNIGFIIASIMLHTDFIQATMAAVNCGFDTDCTAATVGAILGILEGADSLVKKYGFADMRFKLGVKSSFESDKVEDLAKAVAEIGVAFTRTVNSRLEIKDCSGEPKRFESVSSKLACAVEYLGEPAIGFGETAEAVLRLKNNTGETVCARLGVSAQTPITALLEKSETEIAAHSFADVRVTLSADKNARLLPDGNPVTLTVSAGGEEQKIVFGLAGKYRWRVYGPYWKNIVTVPPLKPGESYWSYFNEPTEEKMFDLIRHFHMNSLPDAQDRHDSLSGGETVDVGIDEFRLDDHRKFAGQATYWLETAFYSEQEGEIGGIQIGYSDAFKFYLNGELLAERNEPNMYTPENVHLFHVKVRKGVNKITVMLVRHNDGTKFSYNLLTAGVTSDHLQPDHINI